MEISIFHRKSQYIYFFASFALSLILIITVFEGLFFMFDNYQQTRDAIFWIAVFVLAYCFLYGLLGLYASIVCIIYDLSTLITIDQKMRNVVYYNKYSGTIKFHVDDIIECTYLSKSYPRLMTSYTRIVLKNEEKILLGQYIDEKTIISLNPMNCKYNHKESIAYEELLKSLLRGIFNKTSN